MKIHTFLISIVVPNDLEDKVVDNYVHTAIKSYQKHTGKRHYFDGVGTVAFQANRIIGSDKIDKIRRSLELIDQTSKHFDKLDHVE